MLTFIITFNPANIAEEELTGQTCCLLPAFISPCLLVTVLLLTHEKPRWLHASPSYPKWFCGIGLSPSSKSRSWLASLVSIWILPSPQWLLQGQMRPEQYSQKPQEICQGCGDTVSFYPVGLEHKCVALLCAVRHFGHILPRATAEEIEPRNKEWQNQGFEMLDQALPEDTFTLGIYCLNNLIWIVQFHATKSILSQCYYYPILHITNLSLNEAKQLAFGHTVRRYQKHHLNPGPFGFKIPSFLSTPLWYYEVVETKNTLKVKMFTECNFLKFQE